MEIKLTKGKSLFKQNTPYKKQGAKYNFYYYFDLNPIKTMVVLLIW